MPGDACKWDQFCVGDRKKKKAHCQPYPEIRFDEIHHRITEIEGEIEAGIERGRGIGRGEFMCVTSKHEEKKKGE